MKQEKWFKAIESAIPIEVINETIAQRARPTQRVRKLPAHLVVCLVINPGKPPAELGVYQD